MATAVSLKNMAEKWPSELVARESVGQFTGGVLTSKSMANMDSLGEGPESIRIGRKIAYRVEVLISWLESRATAGRD